MARYGVNQYGTAFYGEDIQANLRFDIVARPLSYGSVQLTFPFPVTGNYPRIRIVRSLVGFPVSETNGDIVIDATSLPDGGLVDRDDITPGSFYYYGAFVFSAEDQSWYRIGVGVVLVPFNYGGSDAMYRLLPSIMRAPDLTRAATSEDEDNPTLRKFMATFGFAWDEMRSVYGTLNDIRNPLSMFYPVVADALADLGIPSERSLDPEINRRLLANAAHFYRIKGTPTCVKEVASTVTGWAAYVQDGANQIWDLNYADAVDVDAVYTTTWTQQTGYGTSYPLNPDGSSGGLSRTVDSGLTWFSTQRFGGPTLSNAHLTFVPERALNTTYDSAFPSEVAATGIPVFGGSAFYVSVVGKAMEPNSPTTLTVGVRWLDLLGYPISDTSSGGMIAGENGKALPQNVAERVEGLWIAPDNAVYAAPYVLFTGTHAGVSYLFRNVACGVQGTAIPNYQPPRQIQILLQGDRRNFIANPSFEVDTSSWATTGSASFTRDTTSHGTEGNASGLLTYTGPSTAFTDSPDSIRNYVSTTIATTPGTRYYVRMERETDAGAVFSIFYGARTRSTGGGGFDSLNAPMTYGAVPGASTFLDSAQEDITAPVPWGPAPVLVFTATGTSTEILVGFTSYTSGTASVRIDDVAMEAQPFGTDDNIRAGDPDYLRPYFDGDSFSVYSENVWEGEVGVTPSQHYTRRSIRDARLREILPRYLPLGRSFNLIYAPTALYDNVYQVRVGVGAGVDAPTATVGASRGLSWLNLVDGGRSITTVFRDRAQVGASETIVANTLTNATTSLAVVWNISPQLPSDNFNRANGALGTTPNGYTWTTSNPTDGSKQIKIDSNHAIQAGAGAGTSVAGFNLGTALVDVQVDITWSSTASLAGLFIAAPSANWAGYQFVYHSSGAYVLFRNGSDTGVSFAAAGTLASGATATLRMVHSPSGTVKCYVNGTLSGTYTDAIPLTDTWGGIAIRDDTGLAAYVDNFVQLA